MSKVSELKKPAPKLDDVTSWERSTYSLAGQAQRYNPDQLVRRHGLPIYAKMRNDEQVKAVMQFKRDAIMGRGWQLVYDEASTLGEDEKKKRIAVMTKLLNATKGSFKDGLNNMWTGRDYGFSLTEKVYTEVKCEGGTYVGLKMLLGRDPSDFNFETDEYGVLKRCVQRIGGKQIEINLAKFLYYVHQPEFDPYFGRSDLREAYRPWYLKERFGDYWALYLERFAGGFMIVTQGETSNLTPNSPTYASLQNVLTNLHGSTGIILPKGVTAELQFPPSQAAFQEAITFMDLAIAKAGLMPNLLGLSHTGQTGAYSQSQTQLEAFIWTLNSDGERGEACINEQIVQDLGDQNWDDDDYPRFRFKPASIEHIKWIVETWTKLTTAKNVVSTESDEAHLRKLLDMPERTEEDTPIVDPNAELQLKQDAQAAALDPNSPINKAKADAAAAANKPTPPAGYSQHPVDVLKFIAKQSGLEIDPKAEASMRAICDEEVMVPEPPAPKSGVVPHGTLRSCNREQFDRATQRVLFSVIERRQDMGARDLVTQIAAQVSRATRRILGNDEQLATLTDTDVADIASVELSSAEKGKLNAAYKRSLGEAWGLGGTLARNELARAKGERNMTFTDLRERASSYFEANAFRMAGNVSDATKAIIQQELQNAVKFGYSPPQTRQQIWDRLVSKGMTSREAVRGVETDAAVIAALDELWVDDEPAAAAYLDTLARTNLYEAMNEARFAEFTDPALDGFVQALEYSAVLDERTTEICQALDDDIFAADSSLWDTYRPPNHYNCRSILVPITQADGWDGTEDPAPDVNPQEGFGAGDK